MDTDHQCIVRIKSFLSSTELINSPTAQELYKWYCELSNSAAQRLVECDVLLQKKQKIDAVALAQQEPNLFDLIDTLFFPERRDLLVLADLYDWAVPNEINADAVSRLKKAVSEMDDLRPLLAEFRRIARTDQVKNKLMLLRKISKIDKENPEWQQPLVDVENQYVSMVIADAQKAILSKDFPRLEQIYAELKDSNWVVAIPTIVLQKVGKIVEEHRRAEAKRIAVAILDRINSSYGSFDTIGLDDAFVSWNEHCRKNNYSPDENEKTQLKEASAYLASEKKKQKDLQDFQALLQHITSLIDSSAPLLQVEKNFAKAQSSGLEIPDYISRRVEKYRTDIERELRTAAVIRGLKIVGTVAVILLIIGGAAVWGIQIMIEENQAKNLYSVIREGKIVEAQALLKEIETRYPQLSSRPKISRARAALENLVSDENARSSEFARILNEISELKKQWPPDKSLKEKVASAEKLAMTDIEKERVNDARSWIDRAFIRRENEVEEQFLNRINAMKKYQDETLAWIQKGEFDQAEKALSNLERIHDEVTAMADVSSTLLADAKDLLNASETLRSILTTRKARIREIAKAQNAILTAENYAAIENAIRTYDKILEKNRDSEESMKVSQSLEELSYFKAILNFQSGHSTSIPAEYAGSAYFKDVKTREARNKQTLAVKKELTAAFDSLQKNTNHKKLVFVRVNTGDAYKDIYAYDQQISSMSIANGIEISLSRTDGTRVYLRGTEDNLSLQIGDDDYPNCRLLYPRLLSYQAVRASAAPHQKLIEKIFTELNTLNDSEIFRSGIAYLKMIKDHKTCAPYWKMKLSLRILDSLTKIDLTPDKSLAELKDQLVKLQALDNVAGDPLENKFLAEKITLFFRSYDFSVLDKSLAQNAAMQKFYNSLKSCKLQCLGFATQVNNNLKYTICSDLKSAETEVFCFDENTSGIMLVGRHGSNGLIIDDKYLDKVAGHLLLTSLPVNSFSTGFNELKNDKSGIDLQKIDWPEFWPQNMRGDAK